jgi:hypothetical protein
MLERNFPLPGAKLSKSNHGTAVIVANPSSASRSYFSDKR